MTLVKHGDVERPKGSRTREERVEKETRTNGLKLLQPEYRETTTRMGHSGDEGGVCGRVLAGSFVQQQQPGCTCEIKWKGAFRAGET